MSKSVVSIGLYIGSSSSSDVQMTNERCCQRCL